MATVGRAKCAVSLDLMHLLVIRVWQGYEVPLVADIHFQPKVAMEVAEAFEKIRINPGNFVDGRKTFDEYVYDSKVTTPFAVLAITHMFTRLELDDYLRSMTELRSYSSCRLYSLRSFRNVLLVRTLTSIHDIILAEMYSDSYCNRQMNR